MKLITIPLLQQLIQTVGLENFFNRSMEALEQDLRHWPSLKQSARHAFHYPFGVTELMPCADDRFYGAKYVNGHPRNTATGKLSVTAIGLLADVPTGYPLMITEMTLLTAIRTAAVCALAARHLGRADSHHAAIIGTGAQAEFQILALATVLPIKEISYFDTDPQAMRKFSRHLENRFTLHPCASIEQAFSSADIWITATAAKQRATLITASMLRPGIHITAIGGDCPGKTELEAAVLKRCKVVVEYIEQTAVEGEVQQTGPDVIHAELWQVINGDKPARESSKEITLFDAVGIGMEDFSILKLVYELARQYNIGEEIAMIPELDNPKDLYSLLAP